MSTALICLVAAAALGAAAGPVLAWSSWTLSVPSGEPRRSHCQDCGTAAPAPTRPRCPGCGRGLGPSVWWMSAAAAAACAVCGWRIGPHPALVAYLAAALAAVVLAVTDARVKRLPNVLLLPLYPLTVAVLGVAALTNSHHGSLLRALLAMATLFGSFYLLALASPRALGLGDVKLVGVLGLLLGWLSWAAVLAGVFLGFVAAALAGLGLLVARRAGRKDTIPFGPYLLLGALLALIIVQ